MKSNAKIKLLISVTLGIVFTFSLLIYNNLNFNEKDNDNEYVKASEVSGKIHIIGNSGWVDFRNDGNCTGQGTSSDPYIIEDLVIDGGGSGNCIWIENSNVPFIIRNCHCSNSGSLDSWDGGIFLSNTHNGDIINNNCPSNGIGICLYNACENITISGNIVESNAIGINLDGGQDNVVSGNTVNNNDWGIYLSWYSSYNTISGNTANKNILDGIYLDYQCDYNIITENTANRNDRTGIRLYQSDNNEVSGNTLIGNTACINERDCSGNTIENNYCRRFLILGYDLFFFIAIIGVISVIIIKKNKFNVF